MTRDRYAEFADRAEIADLVTRLGHLLDERRYADIRTVYTADVAVRTPRVRADDIETALDFLRANDTGAEQTQHVNTDVLVDLDGDRADVTVNAFVHFFEPGKEPHRTSGLRNVFSAVRTEAGWRFSRAEMSLMWQRAA
ncbi:nuclear transport factor 2 family protein [Thermomonospora umbrina]|uniref:SnoaL-like protein n=1 Tax=Thermomonospora umbrina TaxID=111806 RepID=A0A3D9SPC8_9ACTN|nr:nuclear transport factor 2 family protein [Thermomonospora umbrina]REE97826.1 SnoaL-like protein [Thermomonospora umbrina]